MSAAVLLPLLLATTFSPISALAPAPAVSSEPAPAGRLVTLQFVDPGVQVNSSQEIDSLSPPIPPGLTLVRAAPAIGLFICSLDDDVTLTPADFCARLELSDPSVAFCEPNDAAATIEQASAPNATNQNPSATPNDPLYSQQYSLRSIGLPAAWSSSKLFGSTSVKVCMVDTGIDTTDPDFAGSIVAGTAFINAEQLADYTDGNAHGSFTAGGSPHLHLPIPV